MSRLRLLFPTALALAFALSLSTAGARQPWVVLKDCRLMSDGSADADSFHVKAEGKEYIFRLYFADAPETDMSFADRVQEQAKYFGVTPQQAVQLGNYAKNFTREKLSRPFTVRTCMQDAMGRSKLDRYYAFVETTEGDLAELLVANGLARVFGSAATPVGLSSPERQWQKLERLEREAKQQKVGGWGAAAGRMNARLAKQPPKSGPDSFNAFFHPERVVSSNSPEAVPQATPISTPAVDPPTSSALAAAPPPAGGKLDVNTATSAQLLDVPGVGPVIASRIMAARPFKSADDLRTVKGIGPKKYAEMRPHFAP